VRLSPGKRGSRPWSTRIVNGCIVNGCIVNGCIVNGCIVNGCILDLGVHVQIMMRRLPVPVPVALVPAVSTEVVMDVVVGAAIVSI
jgi:hypothetical protein